jgi:hypothetical protein
MCIILDTGRDSAVPMVGSWYKHGFHWYTTRFFDKLCTICNYEPILSNIWGRTLDRMLVLFSYRKIDESFVSEERFKELRWQ